MRKRPGKAVHTGVMIKKQKPKTKAAPAALPGAARVPVSACDPAIFLSLGSERGMLYL